MKPGYKQTEIGFLPEEWEVKTLGSLTTLLTNGFVGTATTAYIEGDEGVLYIQGYNIQENGFNFHGIKRVSKAFHARNKKSCLQAGDLLTIQTGDIGVTTVVPPELSGANCHALIISRLRKQESEPGYYCQYFNSERGRVAFKEIETGTTMKHLNGGDMKRLFLPSPPVEQQCAIATALSDVDGLLAGLDRLIAKKRDLKQAAMQQLLTGQTRLPGFHGEWEIKTLGDITDSLDNLRVPLNEAHRETMRGDYPYCGANGVLGFVDGYVIDDDIILMAEDGGYFDEYETRPIAYRMSGKCWVNNHAHILKSKPGFDQGFIFYSLVHKNILPFLASGTRAKLNKSEMNKIEVRLPKEQPEQTAIAEVLTEMDAELAALEQRREKTRALKQAMMQELLTGRTRLI
jgi:type I restriction enzyme, S subunit